MSKITGNEPAIPVVINRFDQRGNLIGATQQTGITIIQQFSMAAMQGIAANPNMIDTDNWQWLAENSVKAAYALIAELNKEDKP